MFFFSFCWFLYTFNEMFSLNTLVNQKDILLRFLLKGWSLWSVSFLSYAIAFIHCSKLQCENFFFCIQHDMFLSLPLLYCGYSTGIAILALTGLRWGTYIFLYICVVIHNICLAICCIVVVVRTNTKQKYAQRENFWWLYTVCLCILGIVRFIYTWCTRTLHFFTIINPTFVVF